MAAEYRHEVAAVARWAEGMDQLYRRIAGRFRRSEPRRRVRDYLQGLLSPVERKNGWPRAEQVGDATPYGVQRLLSTYVWDADLVRDDLRDYVVEHLADAAGVRVVDETGCRKKGDKSVGVQRQYSGTAGRIENCQVGVFLAYAGARGRALLDRELYLPQGWTADRDRRREAGVPADAVFRTKPQLAQRMLGRARAAGVPCAWVTGDAVYGSDRPLRWWLEAAEMPYVMAIKRSAKLWAGTDKGPLPVRADRLASQVDKADWVRGSAGDGAQGPRVYDGATVALRPLRAPGQGHGWRVRRSIAPPEAWACYVCFGPAETRLQDWVRVAGVRWAIEACCAEAQGQVGLDPYEVRQGAGWYRPSTLAMLAHAYLSVIKHQARDPGGAWERGALRTRMPGCCP